GGALRLSATFEYANGAAMFFEMLLPLALGVYLFWILDFGFWISGASNPKSKIQNPKSILPILACAVVQVTLLLTLSRASLGGAPSLAAREWVTVPVTARNDGPMIWRAQGALAVHLGYHWLSEDRRQIVYFEGARTVLPHDVGPGESVALRASLVAPPREGTYY